MSGAPVGGGSPDFGELFDWYTCPRCMGSGLRSSSTIPARLADDWREAVLIALAFLVGRCSGAANRVW